MPTRPPIAPVSRTAIRTVLSLAAAAALPGRALIAQVSVPVADVHYDVSIDSAGIASHKIGVVTTLTLTGTGQVVLSLPAWTPGAYEMDWFARYVSAFKPTAGDGRPLTWDKVDYETWRIDPAGAKSIRVAFDYEADTLDNAAAWTRPDFAMFNGTNLFLYPVGRGFTFPATVTVHAPAGWRIATGMFPTAAAGTYAAPTYHDLVDMPFFVGRFDIDSERVSDRWVRFASYPAGSVAGARRAAVMNWLSKVIPPEAAVFKDVPWPDYTVLQVTDSAFGGASGLEHQDSHLDIVGAGFLDNPFMPGLYAHEIFHSWNVKRLRPAEMVPYRYDVPQPTPWLWVSEGITDYYADLAQVRGGLIADSGFYALADEKMGQVSAAPPVALTDASLTTWIHPVDGTQYVYYPKGSLAGLVLDILIRDGSANHRSLDDVMRELYETTYKKGRGFTGTDWWGAVSRASGGKSFADFNRRYIDGRDPFPWDSILPIAGLRLVSDTVREPRLGIMSAMDSGGVRVTRVEPGGAAADGGIQPGDLVLSIGDLQVIDGDFGPKFRAMFSGAAGGGAPRTVSVRVRRNGAIDTLQVPIRLSVRVNAHVAVDPAAPAKAAHIRDGILRGTTEP
jgi:predicted metalloprotease with PDZ domain